MIIRKISDMKGGWYIGDFDPSVFKTNAFEVGYKLHEKGSDWDCHYHKKSWEVNLLIHGKMKMQDQIINAGDIFIINPWEIGNPEFLEDCEVVTVKIPSVLDDKYIVKND